jgi:hypothetical protein
MRYSDAITLLDSSASHSSFSSFSSFSFSSTFSSLPTSDFMQWAL